LNFELLFASLFEDLRSAEYFAGDFLDDLVAMFISLPIARLGARRLIVKKKGCAGMPETPARIAGNFFRLPGQDLARWQHAIHVPPSGP
jgi:hypothetical protein